MHKQTDLEQVALRTEEEEEEEGVLTHHLRELLLFILSRHPHTVLASTFDSVSNTLSVHTAGGALRPSPGISIIVNRHLHTLLANTFGSVPTHWVCTLLEEFTHTLGTAQHSFDVDLTPSGTATT